MIFSRKMFKINVNRISKLVIFMIFLQTNNTIHQLILFCLINNQYRIIYYLINLL